MDVGKRGLSMAFRELYFYMDLIDQQMTRTMTRAQWGILGYGPYANLPLERREEVVDRHDPPCSSRVENSGRLLRKEGFERALFTGELV